MTARNKNSSWFRTFVNYVRKNFIPLASLPLARAYDLSTNIRHGRKRLARDKHASLFPGVTREQSFITITSELHRLRHGLQRLHRTLQIPVSLGLAFVCGGDASDVVGGASGDARVSRCLGQKRVIKVAVHRNQNIKNVKSFLSSIYTKKFYILKSLLLFYESPCSDI